MSPDAQPEEDEVVIAVDRTNPVLGNPHILKNKYDYRERDRVCDAYDRDLEADFMVHGPKFQAIKALADRVLQGEQICLQCHCKPLRCHGDSIAAKVAQLVRATLT